MIDPKLERNLSDCTELLEMWREFHDFLAASQRDEAPTPERDATFLQVKSRIAMLHDSFMSVLMADRNIGQSVLTIVSRAITLHHLTRMSVAEIKKMEIEWHQAFLLLQETIGNLEEKRDELAEVSEAAYKADKFRHNMRQRVDHVLKSNAFRGLMILLALIFGTVGVQVLGIWDWGNLRNYGPTQTAFYTVYDKGLRLLFGTLPYYRLEWVDIPVDPEESRDFYGGGGFWYQDMASLSREEQPRFNAETYLNGILSQSTRDALANNTETKTLWAYNSDDFIVQALFLMDSRSEASRLAETINRELSTGSEGDLTYASNRANILIVLHLLDADGNPTNARDDFNEFRNRAPNLIW